MQSTVAYATTSPHIERSPTMRVLNFAFNDLSGGEFSDDSVVARFIPLAFFENTV